MLTFLWGVDLPAKREYIGQKLYETVSRGEQAVLIVPEQENFDRDKELMLRYGEKISNGMRITSISRFCRDILESHMLAVKPRADDTAVNVLMSLAVKQVSDELEIYGGHYRRPGRVRELVRFYNEIANAGMTPEDLCGAGQGAGGSLRQKTKELSLIFTAYEGLLSARFSTQTDNINVAAKLLNETNEFAETDFWFDDFRGFTGAQIKWIAALLPRCRNVYISLTGCPESDFGVSFPHVLKNRRRLKAAADSAGVETREIPVKSGEKTEGLAHLRENLYAPAPEPFAGVPGDIRVLKAADRYEECEVIALTARKLLDGGVCRARDIAVLHRDESLTAPLIAALKKYGVPVFEDDRRTLFSYPLVRLILSAVEIAAKGFATETVLSALKTDMTGIPVEDVSALQNYVYRWQIEGTRWESDFTGNPQGYGVEFDDDSRAELARLNEVRRRFCMPVQALREALKKENAAESCRAVYFYLKQTDAAAHFQAYAEYLYARGEEARAVECAGVWDACMEHLDAIVAAVGENAVSPLYFHELLTLSLSGGSIGYIPPGVDKMTVGSVDRTRILGPKAVFIPGFIEGSFPRRTASGGLLSSKELRALSMEDLPLERLPEDIYEEERLILYNALNLPSYRLYLSYPAARTTGEKTEPSPVIDELTRLYPDLRIADSAALKPMDKILTPESAFGQYAAALREKDPLAETLASVLSADPAYSADVRALLRAVQGLEAGFSDPGQAVRLFGKNIGMSASKAETYAKCPFKYFCRYGMGVEKISASRLDSRINGLLIHKVMEDVILKHRDDNSLPGLSDADLRAEVNASVDAYCEEFLGGLQNLAPAMQRTLGRLKNEIFELLSLRRDEFNISQFRVADTELKIGYDDGIGGYVVPLPDGGALTIYGSADRVDLMRDGQEQYVRVIDYKTGGKEFRLSDVFYGLNMQMLIYLFAICENGVERYGDMIPAGILYVPAKTAGQPLERRATEDEVTHRRYETGRMNGIILESQKVICGMEASARGVFIDAAVLADGTLTGHLLSLREFGLLHKKIDDVLRQLGTDLHDGVIPVLPVEEGGHTACEYCDYSAVCLRESGGPKRTVQSFKHEEARKMLDEEATEA